MNGGGRPRPGGAQAPRDASFPDGDRLIAGLDRVARREAWVALLGGAARGTGVGAGLVLALGVWLTWNVGVAPSWAALAGLVLAAAAAGSGLSLGRLRTETRRLGGSRMRGAHRVEGWVSDSRNLVITAAELVNADAEGADPVGIPVGIVPRQIVREAAARVSEVDPRARLPLHRPLAGLFGGGALGVAAILLSLSGLAPLLPDRSARSAALVDPAAGFQQGGVGALSVQVRVVPPAYTGDSTRVFRDPDHLEGVRGSRLEILAVATHGDAQPTGDAALRVSVETSAGRRWLDRSEDGDVTRTGGEAFEGTLPLDADDYILVQLATPQARDEDRRFITLAAHADPVPGLRFLEPGQDLYLPDGDHTLEVVVEAEDDRALRDLRLFYTRVSGFGELFEFEEGELPLEITRTTARRWTGRLQWDLSSLNLDRGDAVVYRAEAHDHRPGAPPGESDTWTVEVLGSEAAPSGGFAGEDEMTRYALSQQMILVMTQRLLEGADTLSRDRFLEEAVTLAAAQRRVRAEFVFMLGGELEDEALHAAEDGTTGDDDHDHAGGGDDHAHDDDPVDPDAPTAQDLHEAAHARADADAAEGRLAQEGRIQLARAIQAMAQAAVLLSEGEAEAAIAPEERALEHLKQAFSSSRYLLRALSEREELDLARRLSGDRGTVVAGARTQEEPDPDPRDEALRSVLGGLLTLVEQANRNDVPGDLRAELATRMTAADPADPRLRGMASRLLADSNGADGNGEPATRMEDLIVELGRLLRERAPRDPEAPPSPAMRRMTGAWLGAGNSP